MIVPWLVFTLLLITEMLTFLAVRFFQCCSLWLIILQALVTLSWSSPAQPASLPRVPFAVTSAGPAWPGLNLTVWLFQTGFFLHLVCLHVWSFPWVTAATFY